MLARLRSKGSDIWLRTKMMMYYRRSGLPWVLAAGLPSSMGSLGSLGDWVPWAPGYLGSLGSICSVFLYAGKLIDTISFRTVQCCSCIMWGRFWLKIQDVGLQKVMKYLDKFKFMHDALPVLPKMPVHCALSKIAVPEFQRSRNFDKVVEEVGWKPIFFGSGNGGTGDG